MNLRLEMTVEQMIGSATLAKPQPSRPAASRKLLARKAIERVPLQPGDTLEASFPDGASTVEDTIDARPAEPHAAPSSAPSVAIAQCWPMPLAWSNEDESGFQALIARRKAAGYQRRGKDVSSQVLRPGDIKPNAETVVATIVGIVADRGSVPRADLIDLMAAATFPHPKARPTDKAWCQGYVGGAIRNGFLVVEHSATAALAKEA